jgi:hypothetical protein
VGHQNVLQSWWCFCALQFYCFNNNNVLLRILHMHVAHRKYLFEDRSHVTLQAQQKETQSSPKINVEWCAFSFPSTAVLVTVRIGKIRSLTFRVHASPSSSQRCTYNSGTMVHYNYVLRARSRPLAVSPVFYYVHRVFHIPLVRAVLAAAVLICFVLFISLLAWPSPSAGGFHFPPLRLQELREAHRHRHQRRHRRRGLQRGQVHWRGPLRPRPGVDYVCGPRAA